jgi:diacylglycerol kinase family enzyme
MNADRKLKDKIGIFAYLFAVIKSLKKPRRNYRIVINNKEEKIYRAKSIIVANMGKITGGIQAVPDAHPQNGRLHVGVIKAFSILV